MSVGVNVAVAELAATNKVVAITFTIRDAEDNECVRQDQPVEYLHGGGGRILPRIEEVLEGRPVGHEAVFVVDAAEAYGDYDPDLTFTDALSNVPEELRFVGAELDARNDKGEVRRFRVIDIEDDQLTVDANHPLAGKRLTYRVKIVGVRDATKDEIEAGQALS